MFHEAAELGADGDIRADVCIVGAGAAGIAIAREFIGAGQRVAVIAGGGRAFDRRTQDLYRGENIGTDAYSTYRSRVRGLGGSTTRWAGQSRPLERIDFEQRDAIPYSGWPFARDHLEPWYRRAQAVCCLGPYDYDPGAWSANGPAVMPVAGSELELRTYQFAWPTDLGLVYGDELAAAANVHVYLDAHVVEIELTSDTRAVAGMQVATLTGRRTRCVAARYVLACGGIENARLLLASNRVAPSGVGNGTDLVGRFYMDHPFFFTGYIEPSSPSFDHQLHVIDYDRVGREQRAHLAVALRADVARAEGLNGCAVYFVRRPAYKLHPGYSRPGVQALTALADVLRGLDPPDGAEWRRALRIVGGLPGVAASTSRQLIETVRPRPRLALRTALENTPNPDSRVTLSGDRDALGVPRVQVDWRLNRTDRRGMQRLYEIMRVEFTRLGIGRLVEDPALDAAGWPVSMTSGMHHMGTTRMHDDPHSGVVDADCRVHGVANLFIAGSSVFPTGGVANPTLTIVALALRLADHLLRN